MAKGKNDWQDTDKVLGIFGEKAGPARRAYRAFVEKGITQGKGIATLSRPAAFYATGR